MNFRHNFNKILKTRLPENPRVFTQTRQKPEDCNPNPRSDTRTRLLLPDYITNCNSIICMYKLVACKTQTAIVASPARGQVSREFHIYSRGMLNLAYIGAKILNFCPITGFVYFCFIINKAWHWSKIQICGANQPEPLLYY